MKFPELNDIDPTSFNLTPEDQRLLQECPPLGGTAMTTLTHLRLDRDDEAIGKSFYPLDHKGPAFTLRDMIAQQDHVAVLDYGAGTGNQLCALLQEGPPHWQSEVDLDQITADAIEEADYSRLSQNWMTRAAPLLGLINYEVMGLGRPELPESNYDLIYSFDAVNRVDSPATMIRGLYRALRPGGAMYLNTPPQLMEPVFGVATVLAHQGGGQLTHHGHGYAPRSWGVDEKVVSFKLTKAA